MKEFTEPFGSFDFEGFGNKQRSPREIELAKEEKGELYGLRVFPNNPRGQRLIKKEYLGLLDPEEKEELRRLNQLQTREKTMSPELQKLWERTEANDPNVEQISMNQGSSVEVLPDDEQEKIIWTYGLGGCFGTLVFSEDERGRKTAVLTHFNPLSISANIGKLIELIKSNPAMKMSKYKQLILLAPGDYEQNPETKKWRRKIRDQQKAERLTNVIQTELGPDVEVKLEPYSTQKDAMTKDQGSLIVRIPPKGQATYRTWFSQGQLGKTDKNRINELKEYLKK